MELNRGIEVTATRNGGKTSNRNQIGQHIQIPKELTQRIHGEAQKDPALNALCSLFALRERSRRQITLRNLTIVMIDEGFNFNKKDFEQCFMFLASLGVGTLDRDLKGNIRSLKNIRFSLQNLGLAALGRPQDAPVAAYVDTKKPLSNPPKSESVPSTGRNIELKIEILGQTVYFLTTAEKATKILLTLLSEIE